MSSQPTRPAAIGDELIALAHRLADAAGAVARRHYRTPVAVTAKGDASPVTIADREVEAAIRAILAAERPRDGVLGEEEGASDLDAEWVWVIDPIDGTKSFIVGRPLFTTLIGLLHRGVPVLGVIDQGVIGDRWFGAAGRPSTLNGAPIRTRSCGTLSDATFAATAALGPGSAPAAVLHPIVEATRYAVWGGDAYLYGLLAAGFIDVMVESGLQPYDWAALVPVIEGAGGMITNWSGAPLRLGTTGDVVAAGDPRIHRAAMDMMGRR